MLNADSKGSPIRIQQTAATCFSVWLPRLRRKELVSRRMMEFEDIERILELVRQHDLAEFEVESGGMKLRVRKASAVFPTPPAAPAATAPSAVPAPPQALSVSSAPVLPAAVDEESVELAVVKSPIVGTFYR